MNHHHAAGNNHVLSLWDWGTKTKRRVAEGVGLTRLFIKQIGTLPDQLKAGREFNKRKIQNIVRMISN